MRGLLANVLTGKAVISARGHGFSSSPSFSRPHHVSKGGVDAQPLGVVDIFMTGQSAVDRLTEQPDKAMLLILAQATILQVVCTRVSLSTWHEYAKHPYFSGLWRKSHAKPEEFVWEMRAQFSSVE